MRRRHLRGVLKIGQQVYPRPGSLGLFMSELAYEESRVYLTARLGGTVVGYGGLMCVLEDGHVTTIAVDPRWHRYKLGPRLLLDLARGGIDEGAQNTPHEVRASQRGAPDPSHRFGSVPPRTPTATNSP